MAFKSQSQREYYGNIVQPSFQSNNSITYNVKSIGLALPISLSQPKFSLIILKERVLF